MEFMGGSYELSCRSIIDAMALHQTPVIRQVHWWNKRIPKPSKPSTDCGFELSKFVFFFLKVRWLWGEISLNRHALEIF